MQATLLSRLVPALRSFKHTVAVTASIAVACMLAPAAALAKTVDCAPGSFDVPDDLQVLDQSEETSAKTGGVEGMVVFGPASGPPRAVFIVAYVQATTDKPASDPLDAAVKIGNPADPSLSGKDARSVDVGGAPGGAYVGTLPNGLAVHSYVVSNNGFRLTVLLKGPTRSPYKEQMDAFAVGVEHFRWAAPRVGARVSAASAASASTSDPGSQASAMRAASANDHAQMLALLAGDTPLSQEQLQAYLAIALRQPGPQPGLRPAGDTREDWGTALGRLVFSSKEKSRSLEFWTSIRGGDQLDEVLKKNGVGITAFHGSMLLSGAPRADSASAITSDVVAWYGAKLRDRPQ